MLAGAARQRALALALVLSAFLIGTYWSRDHLRDAAIRWKLRAGQSITVSKDGSSVSSHFGSQQLQQLESVATTPRVNAAFVVLVRNSDLNDILASLQQVETQFNRRYNYPYVFLNDEPFDEKFIAVTSQAVTGNATYGLVPKDHWEVPAWIDKAKAAKARKKMQDDKVIYGGSETYRKMCRYQSGFFYRHELMQQYDYYWRIEPGVKYFCSVDYDPFLLMQRENKKYGFTISIKEYEATIPTLWKETKEFMEKHPEHLAKDNSMWWISDNKGETYNLCHFWSNFEIGALDFLRSQAYTDYFDHLDKAGGFSYERWGDAPVHSIAAALFLPTEQVHFFSDVGYWHVPFGHCPKSTVKQGCFCDQADSFEDHWYSCTSRWHDLLKSKNLE